MNKAKVGRPRSIVRSKLSRMKIGDEIIVKQTPDHNRSLRSAMQRVSQERVDARFSLRSISGGKVIVRCLPKGDIMMNAAKRKPSLFKRLMQAVGL